MPQNTGLGMDNIAGLSKSLPYVKCIQCIHCNRSILLGCNPIVFVGTVFVRPGRPWDYACSFSSKNNRSPKANNKGGRKYKKMKFPSKAKGEINCALSDCCCSGSMEFRSEFEANLCEHHYMMIVNMGWRDRNP